MNTNNSVIRCSVTDKIIGKAGRTQYVELTQRLRPVDISIDELIQHVAVKGHTICCADLKTDDGGFAKRNGDSFLSAQIIGVDIDHNAAPFDDLKHDPYLNKYASFAYTTASHTAEHPRYRIMFVLENKVANIDEYKRLVTFLSTRYDGDKNARDATRLWFGNPNAQTIVWGNVLTADEMANILDVEGNAKDEEILFTSFGRRKLSETEVVTMLSLLPAQHDHIDWKRICAAVDDALQNRELAIKILEQWSPCDNKTPGGYRKILANKLQQVKTGTLIYLAKKRGWNPPPDLYETAPKNATEAHDKIESFLLAGHQFRKNIVLDKVEFRDEYGVNWQDVTDYWIHSVLRRMRKLGLKVTKERLNEVLDSDFAPLHDPIKSYFDGLDDWRENDPDHITDLVSLIPTDANIENWDGQQQNMIFRTIIRKYLIGAVAAALDHRPNHIMLILQGGQGIGKTTFLRHLCPKELRGEYYYEGAITDDKDVKIVLAKSFLAVDDELESLTKKQHETIKAIITSENTRVRAPYKRFESTYARRCSFAGSVNRRSFLNDETGNRRFPVIPVGGHIDLAALRKINIDNVWSQAKALYKQGAEYWFTQRDLEAITAWNEAFTVSNQYDDLIQKYVHEGDRNSSHAPHMTATEIGAKIAKLFFDYEGGNININDKFTYGLGKALTKAGFVKYVRKRNGKPVHGYCVNVSLPVQSKNQDAKQTEAW